MSDTEEYYSDFDSSVEQQIGRSSEKGGSSPLEAKSSRGRNSSCRSKKVKSSPIKSPFSSISERNYDGEDMFITGTSVEMQLYDSDDFPASLNNSVQEGIVDDEQAASVEYEDDFDMSPGSPEKQKPVLLSRHVDYVDSQYSDHNELKEMSSVTFAPEAPEPASYKSKKAVYVMKKSKKKAAKSGNNTASVQESSSDKPSSSSRRSQSAHDNNPSSRSMQQVASSNTTDKVKVIVSANHKKKSVNSSVISSAHPGQKQSSIFSSVASCVQPSQYELTHQVQLLTRRCALYHKQVLSLQEKLDETKYAETIETYKAEINDLHKQVTQLKDDNESYKQIVRYQEKSLTEKDLYEQRVSNNEVVAPEKVIEIMSLEVKKCREKLHQHRQIIADYETLHQDLKERLQILSKNNAILRRFKQKTLAKQQECILPAIDDHSVQTADDNASAHKDDMQERMEALERNHSLHVNLLQKELAGLKLSYAESEEGNKRLSHELEKREGMIRLQVHYVKELKKRYVDLGAQMKSLVEANAVLCRDIRAPIKKPPVVPVVPVAPPIVLPVELPVIVPSVAKTGILVDEGDEGGGDVGSLSPTGSGEGLGEEGNEVDSTFLTNQT
ncbi:hypothetical protein EON65_15635 [archaeon]|nr:MAG: hypothetical protein EON65_15635 [archaeon]